MALRAAYTFTTAPVVPAKRLNAFRTDPRLAEEENTSGADEANTGYARGYAVR